MKIVVIIPTYNEKDNIEKLIPILEKEIFPHIEKHEMYILIADDSSPDGTGNVVKQFMKEWKNISLSEGQKGGLGLAYVRAMHYAMDKMEADAVIEFDADFQHDPQDISRLITAMDAGADYVIGSRYIKGGAIPPEWGIHRKFLSFFGSLFARLVLFTFSIHDMTSGIKLTKTSFLKKIDLDNLYSKYYAYKIQILYEAVRLGAKVKEVPIIFRERENGSSKLVKRDLVESFFVVIKLRIRDSKRFIKFLIVGGGGFIINATVLHMLVEMGHFPPEPANLIGAALAIFSNYNFNNLWTFKEERHKSLKRYFKKMLHFYGTSSFGVVVIQTGTIALGDWLFGTQWYTIYFLIGTGFLLVWNFTIYNLVIWRKNPIK